MSESSHRFPRLRRVLRLIWRVLLALFAVAALALLVGATWQHLAARKDAARFPPTGDLVDIGGRRLHLVCRGEGSPTVILEAGAQDWSTGWTRPQARIAEFTRVCAYDRAGLGWSDPSDDPKVGDQMVEDLRKLVRAAKIDPPFVLVGHSLGGNLGQIHASRYPDEVAGLVLVEPGDPAQVIDMLGGKEEIAFGGWVDIFASSAARVGLLRWVYRDLFEGKGYPEQEVGETRARLALPAAGAALASTIRHLPITAVQTRESVLPADLPIVVLYSSKFDEVGTSFENEAEREEFRTALLATWTKLADSSSRSLGLRLVENANHITIVRNDTYAEHVVTAIRDVVDAVNDVKESETTSPEPSAR